MTINEKPDRLTRDVFSKTPGIVVPAPLRSPLSLRICVHCGWIFAKSDTLTIACPACKGRAKDLL